MEEVYVHSLTFHRGKEEGYEKARQEMKEYLEQKKEELRIQIEHSTGQCFPYVMYMTMVDKIINELFKEEKQ